MRASTLVPAILAVPVLVALAVSACKTPNSGGEAKSQASLDQQAGPDCALEQGTWAGRMGFRLTDTTGGAAIECVVLGQGLHHIGLRAGDKITALNGGAGVGSSLDFERTATELAKSLQPRIMHWEFTVERGGQKVEVAPSKDYPGCALFTFDDCGPLGQ